MELLHIWPTTTLDIVFLLQVMDMGMMITVMDIVIMDITEAQLMEMVIMGITEIQLINLMEIMNKRMEITVINIETALL